MHLEHCPRFMDSSQEVSKTVAELPSPHPLRLNITISNAPSKHLAEASGQENSKSEAQKYQYSTSYIKATSFTVNLFVIKGQITFLRNCVSGCFLEGQQFRISG